MGLKKPMFAKCVERKGMELLLETTLKQTTSRAFLFPATAVRKSAGPDKLLGNISALNNICVNIFPLAKCATRRLGQDGL